METFEAYAVDSTGVPRTLNASFDLPLIVSIGASYAGWENWLLAADVRYFDFANTDGFGDPAVFDRTGKLDGVGWRSVMAVAMGAERTVSDALAVRFGYLFNENPVSDYNSFFNIPAATIYQHMLSTGATISPSDWLSINLAYSYFPPLERTGPIFAPGVGAIPGTSVTNRLDVHQLSFGITMYR